VLRLVGAGKISVLFNVPEKVAVSIKSIDQWKTFLDQCSPKLRSDVKERATPEEWRTFVHETQPSLLTRLDQPRSAPPKSPPLQDAVAILNEALADGDATAIVKTLGMIARERGMSQVARETGLARESLYRSLDAAGNPEFATVMKVLSSIGLRLEAKAAESRATSIE